MKQSNYGKYDWDKDDKWKKHMSKVYPEPAKEKLVRMMRRWYKIHVDMAFEPEYQSPEQ